MNSYQHQQFEALGDVTRRAILERLMKGPVSVGELARDLPVSRPAVSQHLGVLKKARLVHDEAVGTRRYYQLDPRGIVSMRAFLDRFWDEALQALKTCMEEK